jgi:hypothetical protein
MNPDLKSRLRRPRLAIVGVGAAAMVAVGGISSASAHGVPINAPCQQVAAVLSDGPDPGADPVGYAQAQIIQLRKLKLSDKKLEREVRALASAYALYVETDGRSKAAKAAVNKAEKAVNATCPGAAQ